MPEVVMWCEKCRSRIARFDTDTIRLPLTKEQFTPLYPHPSHNLPFQEAESWQWFRCPVCHYLPFLSPEHILTEAGFFDVPEPEPEPVPEPMPEPETVVVEKPKPVEDKPDPVYGDGVGVDEDGYVWTDADMEENPVQCEEPEPEPKEQPKPVEKKKPGRKPKRKSK